MSNNSSHTLKLLKLVINESSIPKYNKQRKKYLKRLKRYIKETYPEVTEQKEPMNDRED